jgi:hypothetical protein
MAGQQPCAHNSGAKERRYHVEVRAYGFLPWNLSNFRDKQSVLDVVLAVGFFVNN